MVNIEDIIQMFVSNGTYYGLRVQKSIFLHISDIFNDAWYQKLILHI